MELPSHVKTVKLPDTSDKKEYPLSASMVTLRNFNLKRIYCRNFAALKN